MAEWIAVKDHIVFRPMEEMTTPRNGTLAATEYWWVHHPDKGLVFYNPPKCRRPIGQRNQSREIVDHFIRDMYPDCEAVFLPVTYHDWSPDDY